MKKVFKWLFFLMATPLVCIASLAIYIFFSMKNEDAGARVFADGKALGYPMESMGRATVDLWDMNERRLGRAYFNTGERILITNHHVLKIVCGGTKYDLALRSDCRKIDVILGQNNSDRTMFHGLLTLRKCLEWMDACVLDVNPDEPIVADQEHGVLPKGGSPLVAIPLLEDRVKDMSAAVMTGNMSGQESVFLSTTLPGRPGYSGGPVFSNSGEFVGIFKNANWSGGINLSNLMKIFGLKTSHLMRQQTTLISADSLHNALLCSGDFDSCGPKELTVFSNLVADLINQDRMVYGDQGIKAIKLFYRSFEREVLVRNNVSYFRDMLKLSSEGLSQPEELAKQPWSKNPDRVRDFAVLLLARAALHQDQEGLTRGLDIIEQIDGKSDFIQKLRVFSDSFIWQLFMKLEDDEASDFAR